MNYKRHFRKEKSQTRAAWLINGHGGVTAMKGVCFLIAGAKVRFLFLEIRGLADQLKKQQPGSLKLPGCYSL